MKFPHPFELAVTARSLLEILIAAIFIATFIVQPFRVPSQSMEPTLHFGDFVFADKQSFVNEGLLRAFLPSTEIHRGDLAVFHFQPQPSTYLVKRIIGIPGDRIRLRNGLAYVNGVLLSEPYTYLSVTRLDPFRDDFPFLRSVDPDVDPAWWMQLRLASRGGEITVPTGSYFVLGDNRNNSEDSRYWGFVPHDALVGRPLLVYLSLSAKDKSRESQPLAARMEAFLHGLRILH